MGKKSKVSLIEGEMTTYISDSKYSTREHLRLRENFQ